MPSFISRTESGLIFFAGNPSGGDYVIVYLLDSSVVLQLNLAGGESGFTGRDTVAGTYADGENHRIEVRRSQDVADLTVDGNAIRITAPG